MKFIIFFFIYFLGLGSYLSALSPYADQHFGEQAYWIYLAGQMGYPLGYLVGGYLSDRLRLLRPLLLIGLALLVPAQWLQFTPDLPFPLILTAAICNRMLLAVNLQLASIALLESAGPEPFSRIRSSGTLGFAVIQCALWVTLTVMDYSAAQPFPFSLSGKTGALFFVLCLLPAARIQIHRISHE
ncbi:MAG: hypothetical protein KDK27_21155, partial [Leptospiraceae bacterium]|nr:hypothetical protein [Leptospiraceae bacterium]